MTLRDLLTQTIEADLDKQIIIQKDAEGNSYSPLACCGLAGDEETHLILVPVS